MLLVDEDTSVLKYTRLNRQVLHLIGIWSPHKPLFRTRLYWIYSLFVNVIMMGLFTGLQLVYASSILPDVELFAKSSYVAFTCILANIKGTAFLRNRTLVLKLMATLRDETFQPKNERQERQFAREMRPYKMIYYSFIAVGTITVIAWGASPVVSSVPMDLAFLSWYPFDPRQPGLYVLIWLHQSVSVGYETATNCNMDSMTGAFFSYVSAECVLLADRIRYLDEFTKERLEAEGRLHKNMSQEETHRLVVDEMNTSLLDCVAHYRKIVDFATDVQECYNTIAFVQFASSITSFCMTLFLLALVNLNSGETVSVIAYQGCLTLELFLYCWFGNNVVFKSAEIHQALYECPWVDCSETFKKHVLFFMVRSQRIIQMYAIDFFLINLSTFLSIGRSAWSVFLLLRQMKIE